MSHAAGRPNGKTRKMLLVDVKKTRLNFRVCRRCVHRVAGGGGCSTRQGLHAQACWLNGIRSAAAAWEAHHANKLKEVGCRRRLATLVSLCHAKKDVNLVVHGDDFTFAQDGFEVDGGTHE